MLNKQLIAEGGIVEFDPSFLALDEANALLFYLKNNVNWEQKYYYNYRNKSNYPQPRLTAWYADSPDMQYSYSGVTQKVQPWDNELLNLKNKIQLITKSDYNSVLLNFYRNGNDSVGLHADDEKELGNNANIASVSLGATRKFQLVQYKGSLPYGNYEYVCVMVHY